jgi:molybdopterin-guanine dinucleotide biosynthesis protein A
VLAGGRGERLGGAKATAKLEGRTLTAHAVAALLAVVDEVVVVAKPSTALPPGLDVPVWHDDAGADFHPRHGIVTALRGSAGAPVLVLAVDLPRVTADDLHRLLGAGGTAVAREPGGRVQPLCAVYAPAALAVLEQAPADEALTATVRRLRPLEVDLPGTSLINVNTPGDLAGAADRGTPPACDDTSP